MPKKRHKLEEIVAKQRQVDVLTAQGKSVADAIRTIGVTEVTEVTYYRWKQEYGGLKTDQVRRLEEFELEKTRIIIESWRQHYNRFQPHASLGYRASAPEAFVPGLAAWPSALVGAAPTATLLLATRPSMN